MLQCQGDEAFAGHSGAQVGAVMISASQMIGQARGHCLGELLLVDDGHFTAYHFRHQNDGY